MLPQLYARIEQTIITPDNINSIVDGFFGADEHTVVCNEHIGTISCSIPNFELEVRWKQKSTKVYESFILDSDFAFLQSVSLDIIRNVSNLDECWDKAMEFFYYLHQKLGVEILITEDWEREICFFSKTNTVVWCREIDYINHEYMKNVTYWPQ